MIIYTDILDIIYDYKEQLEIHCNKLKMLQYIKKIDRYEIAVCRNCQTVKVRDYFYIDTDNCNHFFYLVKPIFMINKTNQSNQIETKKLLKPYVFNFYCLICNKYDFFYTHLNH